MAPTASEKRELVKNHLKQLRKELRIMHAGVTEQQTLPDPGEVRTVMTEMETLLSVLEPKSAKKSKKK
ncbi:hypothetical protein [Prochlorococcus sp. MIT 1300]|uniref:hypothetical protein n=1 Tax=Prochlorococcus sp. MIT 1300 TaxID=3096218 RepID=UPI002A75E1FB|nr:hypothetical protein [Prochlorococcus sp. MIT 1300]